MRRQRFLFVASLMLHGLFFGIWSMHQSGSRVKPSFSGPRASDDNAYAESPFRTHKHRPEFHTKGFADLRQARAWVADFVRWYNFNHRHSGIRYVSPAQRHAGEDDAILAARHTLYAEVRELYPAR